jgi:hypothetical protein
MRRRLLIVAATLLAGLSVSAQPPSRYATTAAALRASPVFYHGKQVALVATVEQDRGLYRLAPTAGPNFPAPDPGGRAIYAYWREQPSRTDGEVRGEFWDLGRLTEGDPRFNAYDFGPLLEAANQGRWPGRDQIFVLLGATVVEAIYPDTPTLRALVLAPSRYANRGVKVSGRFRGRNLHADLASPIPSPSKYDFVLQSVDASIWVSGLRPRGRGFELDPGARVDTGRWLQVAGTMRQDGGHTWIEARELEQTTAPEETPVEVDVPPPPREPPPTVVFTAPVVDDTDVDLRAIVRIQFSRDMDARSFKDRIRITYLPSLVDGKPVPPPPPPVWAFNYNVGNRGIELKFARPLERLQSVRVELLPGIASIDGEPLAPWSMTFSTGS